jgi:hypothetical protein
VFAASAAALIPQEGSTKAHDAPVINLVRSFCMTTSASTETTFVDRRSYDPGVGMPARERRQFTNSHAELSEEARELAQAIDQYKLSHRRRFITYEEMLSVVKSLGYQR